MRKKEPGTVSGLHAPPPRATPWAALLVAVAICVLFLAGIGLWRLAAVLLH